MKTNLSAKNDLADFTANLNLSISPFFLNLVMSILNSLGIVNQQQEQNVLFDVFEQ